MIHSRDDNTTAVTGIIERNWPRLMTDVPLDPIGMIRARRAENDRRAKGRKEEAQCAAMGYGDGL